MNVKQKAVIGVGALLAVLRLAFPVKYHEVIGIRFTGDDFGSTFQHVDWTAMGLHLGGIAVVTVALVFILAKKK